MRSHSAASETLQSGKLKVNRYAMELNSGRDSLFSKDSEKKSSLSCNCLIIGVLGHFSCTIPEADILEKQFISNS